MNPASETQTIIFHVQLLLPPTSKSASFWNKLPKKNDNFDNELTTYCKNIIKYRTYIHTTGLNDHRCETRYQFNYDSVWSCALVYVVVVTVQLVATDIHIQYIHKHWQNLAIFVHVHGVITERMCRNISTSKNKYLCISLYTSVGQYVQYDKYFQHYLPAINFFPLNL